MKLLTDARISILRGNAGEIGVLAGESVQMRGVDSIRGSEDPADTVRKLANERKIVVAMSGIIDYVSNGRKTVAISNGNSWMSKLTGTGCMTTALTGAFASGL